MKISIQIVRKKFFLNKKIPNNYCTFEQAKYTILKNGNRITSGSSDICKELDSNSKGVASALMSFGLPKTCPVEQVSFPSCLTYFIHTKFLSK